MADSMIENCSLKIPDHPIVAIAIASFNIVCGIKVCYQWKFTQDEFPMSLDDLFKISLSNVHRQNEQIFQDCSTSIIDVKFAKWTVINAIFIFNVKNQRSMHYSISIILNSDRISSNPHHTNFFLSWANTLASALKIVLTKKEPYQKLRSIIDKCSESITKVSLAHISQLPPINPEPIDAPFLATLLTSHLQTQMTTVIECPTEDIALKYAHFLAHFTLPAQRELSSLKFNPQPIPGLFLQICQRQSVSLEESLLNFNGPCTWVKIADGHIFQTPDLEAQKIAHKEYILTTTIDSDEPESKKKLTKLRSGYKVAQILNPAPWATATVTILVRVPKAVRNLVCEQQLGSIVRMSITLISMVEDRLRESNSNALNSDQKNEIWRTLKLTGKEDLTVVVSVALNFDQNIYKKFFSSKKDTILQLMSSL